MAVALLTLDYSRGQALAVAMATGLVERIRAEALQERIRQKMENRTDKEVYLRGDAGVQYQELMDVFDRLKAAGVVDVGLVAKLPGER